MHARELRFRAARALAPLRDRTTLAAVFVAALLIVGTSIVFLSGGDAPPVATPRSWTIATIGSPTSATSGAAPSTTTTAPTAPPTAARTTVPIPTTTVSPVVPSTAQPSGETLDTLYLRAWVAECERIWSFSTTGQMFDPADLAYPFSIAVCLENYDAGLLTETTPATAQQQGRRDARDFLALVSLSGLICWTDPVGEAIRGCYDPETDTASNGAPALDT